MLSPRVMISLVVAFAVLCTLAGCTQLKERLPLRKSDKVTPAVVSPESSWKEQSSAEGTTLPPNTALPIRKQVRGDQ
jgi:predicted small lipoprotein YifL